MARIPQSELERLKNEISVERLVESAGIELKKAGRDRMGRCPFHADATASLVVTPAKNLWHCFGCGVGGGPIDWVIKKHGISFRHAVELLKADPSLVAEALVAGGDSGVVKRSTVRALPVPVALDADDRTLLAQVIDYYHATLKQSPEALAYLESRGFSGATAMEAIDTFKLGYANRTLGLRLPTKSRVAGAELRTRLQKIGIYRESGHEHFNGSLVIPIFAGDEKNGAGYDGGSSGGNVVEVYGRKLRDDLRPGTPAHLYLPGPHAGVWNSAALMPGVGEELIVCEALIDALTFWCAGFRNVTSAYGVEGVTDELIEAIQAAGIKRVLIAFDRDEAGERGAVKLAARLMAKNVDCYRVMFPKGMDANDYARKLQPAAKSLGLLIRKAEWMGKGVAPTRGNCAPPEVVDGEIKIVARPVIPLAAASLAAATEPISVSASAVKEKFPISPPLPAAVVPSAPLADAPAQVSEREVVLSFGEGTQLPNPARRWRVRGLPKNLSVGVLKVNLMVSRDDGRFHVDTLDLYAARSRAVFLQQAALELAMADSILKADLGRVLLALEGMQDEAIQAALAPKEAMAPTMTEAEHADALALLQSPDLLTRIVADFEACGVVGETTNKQVAYLAAVSRLLERPLAVVIQSSSAAGKSSLMDAVLAFVPEEARTQYSAMTGQSLFYMGQTNLKHKILAIAEEAGASRASYALKLLQSEGELTIASTGSDPATGNLITQEYRVEGPTMLMMTTTAIDLDEELMNRCLVLSVNEDREQTRAIHRQQRERRTLAGMIQREAKTAILTTHQNAQRLLRPLVVVNPWADQLTFLDDRTRTRRDHEKYLTLIDTIALLHQHQRSLRTANHHGRAIEYIEVTLDDIETANCIAHEVLGRSLDELPPQTRRVLAALGHLVAARAQAQCMTRTEVRFTRAQVRAETGLSDTQCRLHLERLTALEYVLVHRGRRGQSYEYELLHDVPVDVDDAMTAPRLAGLIDVAALRASASVDTTMPSSRGENTPFAGPSRLQRGVNAGAVRSGEMPEEAHGLGVSSPLPVDSAEPRTAGAARSTVVSSSHHHSLAAVV
jgi:hypothetical protein